MVLRERERPYKSIPAAGSTNNNVGDRVVNDVISKRTWNINVKQDQLLCYDLKCSMSQVHQIMYELRIE